MNKKEIILNTVKDLIADFLWYDRKEDEDLGRGEIEALVKSGELTVDEIVEQFKTTLIKNL